MIDGRWSRRETLALAGCALVGLLLAIAPHFATLFRYGTWEYVSDTDEAQYLAMTRISYQGETALRDPYAGKWEGLPTQYPWLPLAPTGLFNRMLGLPLLASGLEWRLLGGPLLGAALFLFFRLLLAGTRYPTAWALGCALVCLADAGFIQGRSFFQDFTLIPHLLHGTTPMTKPDALPQFRVISPLLMLPAFILLMAAFLPSTERKWKWGVAGAIGLGLCCQMYFFFWTAALAGLAGYLAIRLTMDWRNPQVRGLVKYGVLVAAGGLLIGAPQIYDTYRMSRQPQFQPLLERLCRGQHVPSSDPYRRMNVVNVWVWAKLLLGAAAILIFRLRGLGLLWWLTFAGYALSISAIVTGLEFENWHWAYVHAPAGELLLLGATAMLLDRVRRFRLTPLWAYPVILLAIAMVWRPYEAIAAPEAARNSQALAQLKPLRPALEALDGGHLLAGPSPETDIALLFSKTGRVFHPYTATISFITDDDANTRHVLNSWLQGQDLEAYLRPSAQGIFTPCAITNPDWKPAAVRAHRGGLFYRLQQGDEGRFLAGRYKADYLLLPSTGAPNALSGSWAVSAHTAEWNLWTRQTGVKE